MLRVARASESRPGLLRRGKAAVKVGKVQIEESSPEEGPEHDEGEGESEGEESPE